MFTRETLLSALARSIDNCRSAAELEEVAKVHLDEQVDFMHATGAAVVLDCCHGGLKYLMIYPMTGHTRWCFRNGQSCGAG